MMELLPEIVNTRLVNLEEEVGFGLLREADTSFT